MDSRETYVRHLPSESQLALTTPGLTAGSGKSILRYVAVEVNARDKQGATPFLKALMNVVNPNVVTVRLLLDHNADPHVRDNYGVTPLHNAVACGRLELVQILLKHDAEANARDNQGDTPFLLASRDGNPGVVRLLLDHSADVHVRDNKGVTPLRNAAIYGRLEVARILL